MDDKTGIYGQWTIAGFHRDRVRVAANPLLALEQRHFMLAT